MRWFFLVKNSKSNMNERKNLGDSRSDTWKQDLFWKKLKTWSKLDKNPGFHAGREWISWLKYHYEKNFWVK